MNNEIKVGDWVKAKNDDDGGVKRGETYKVIKVYDGIYGQMIFIRTPENTIFGDNKNQPSNFLYAGKECVKITPPTPVQPPVRQEINVGDWVIANRDETGGIVTGNAYQVIFTKDIMSASVYVRSPKESFYGWRELQPCSYLLREEYSKIDSIVGFEATVREDLTLGIVYGAINASAGMCGLKGKTFTIKSFRNSYIDLIGEPHMWTPEMFSTIKEKKVIDIKVGDKVVVKKGLYRDLPNCIMIISTMINMAGKTLTVSSIGHPNVDNAFKVKENPFIWTSEMVDLVTEEKPEKVKVVKPTVIDDTPQELFKDVKIGDKVISSIYGEGTVSEIEDDSFFKSCEILFWVIYPSKGDWLHGYNSFGERRGNRIEHDTIIKKVITSPQQITPSPKNLTVVYVTFGKDKIKHWLFLVPENANLKDGDKVYVDTKRGRSIATCVTNPFELSRDGVDAILKASGATFDDLKPVVGFAITKTEHQIKPF